MTFRMLAFAAVAAVLAGSPAGAQVYGRTVQVPVVRAEVEPGATYVGNWTAVDEGLRALMARPRAEDAAVIAEIRAMGDLAPPPFLMEMGRRLLPTDAPEAAYWVRLGLLRMQWAAFACADGSAHGGVSIIIQAFETAEPGVTARFDDPALRIGAYERLGAGDAVFADKVSAWWLCSHGMDAMRAGLDAGPEGPRTLPLSEWRAPQARRDQMEARLRDYLPRWQEKDRAAVAAR